MDLDSDIARLLRSCFPSSVSADLNAVLKHVEVAGLPPTDHDIGPVIVGGERLHIPARIYFPQPEPESVATLTEFSRTLLSCLYTRHHDGHLRELHLQAIISSPLSWVPPFVVQLLGEYVIEIHWLIRQNRSYLRQDSYASFVAENRAFIELTRQRITSYWDCYFRALCPKLSDHAAFQVMDDLVAQAGAARPAAERQFR